MSRIFEHLTTLTNFGPRPIGSQANQAAADFIASTFSAAGLQVEEQPYACTAWDGQKTLLEINGERLDAAANPFSPPCDVTAPVVCAGTLPELELVAAKGKLLLLYGDLVSVPLSPKSWFLKEERDDKILQTLEAIQPAALLAPPTATDYYGQLTEDWELDLPAATISADAARRLMRNPDQVAHLSIEAVRTPAAARNIVARSHPNAKKRLVLCAHFDTKINTPGASDNGGGVAVLLGLAETPLETGFRPRLLTLPGGIRLLDDSFKSAVESIHAAFDAFARMPATRKILVLGNVEEPTGKERDVYRALGGRAARFADLVICVGKDSMTGFRAAAVRAGMTPTAIHLVGSRIDPVAALLNAMLQPGDAVLIKGASTQKMRRLVLQLTGRQVDCRVQVLRRESQKLRCVSVAERRG